MKISYAILGALFFVETDAMLVNHSSVANTFARSGNWNTALFSKIANIEQSKNTSVVNSLKTQVSCNSIQTAEQLKDKLEKNSKILQDSTDDNKQSQATSIGEWTVALLAGTVLGTIVTKKVLQNSTDTDERRSKNVNRLQKRREKNVKTSKNSGDILNRSRNRRNVNTKATGLADKRSHRESPIYECEKVTRTDEIDNLPLMLILLAGILN